MSEHLLPKDLMERLALVDSKLEKLLDHPSLSQDEGLAETQPLPGERFSEDILVAGSEDERFRIAAGFSEGSENSLPFKVAVSALEADSIFQKVDKINRDADVMERVEKLERQNRKITILSSMLMTLTVLMLGVIAFLFVQSNLFNQGVIFQAKEKIDASQPSFGKNTAEVQEAQSREPVAKVNDLESADSVAKVGGPEAKSAAAEPDPKPAKVTVPVEFVGSITSNKYHYPDCKWAAQIQPHKLKHFSSIEEARKQGYIPCPTCQPPSKASDPQPVATLPVPKEVETTSPGKYVGFLSSNKYHYPGCKWAAKIKQYKHQTFSSAKEAQEHGYIPCPNCKPSD
jgi:hypothetical protein